MSDNKGQALLLLMQTIDEQERLIDRLRGRIQQLEQEIVRLTHGETENGSIE